MSPTEAHLTGLIAQCDRAIVDRPDDPAVVLVLAKSSPPRGETVSLVGRRGPRGQVLCVNGDGRTVARFSATAVRAFLVPQLAALRLAQELT